MSESDISKEEFIRVGTTLYKLVNQPRLNGGYVKLKDAGVAQQNKAAAVQQNQLKQTQPDPEEEPDSDNRLSESKPRKNGRRTR